MQNLKDSYLRLLDYFVHHLKAGMLAATAMVAAFGISIFTTNMVLIPDMDQSMVSVNVTMPIGSSLWEETTAIADRVAHKMQEIPEMTDMFYIAQDESATMMANLVSKGERERSSEEVADALQQELTDIAGAEIIASASSSMAMLGGSDIDVEITGDDYATLAMIAGDLETQIAALEDAKKRGYIAFRTGAGGKSRGKPRSGSTVRTDRSHHRRRSARGADRRGSDHCHHQQQGI